MKVNDFFIVGVHRYTFRAGEIAQVIGVKMVTPSNGIEYEPRLSYQIRFPDGIIDYVPFTDVDAGNWELVTIEDLINNGVPKVRY